jgi:hypothetical protein
MATPLQSPSGMKLSSQRTLLGACALGLALLSGCASTPGDPDDPPPPVDPPPPPPVDPPPPPPPVDPPPPPPVDYPPPVSATNVHSDEYDPGNHRLLLSDCDGNTLRSQDADTAERHAMIMHWPWEDLDGTTCVEDLAVGADGRAYAVVFRAWVNPDDGQSCYARDFVSINVATNFVNVLNPPASGCDEDDVNGSKIYSPQLDGFQDRVLYLASSCRNGHCGHSLMATRPDSEPEVVQKLYPVSCYPDDLDCDYMATKVERFVFDPVGPDKRVLVFARTNTAPLKPFIDSIDLSTGAVEETIPIQTTWGDLRLEKVLDATVDSESWRVFVTMMGKRRGELTYAVVAVDRYTGTQTLLYDGRPTGSNETFDCQPNAALDTGNHRLLLAEPLGGYDDCPGRSFVLDLETGTFARL